MQPIRPRSILKKALLCLLPAACCVLNGCNIIGAAAQIMPQPDIAPEYKDLANQTVGVMVWVDRGVRIDYPNLRADIARGLTTKLMQITKPRDQKEEAVQHGKSS